MKKPKISIVATCRNDNHGGDLLYRLQLFVSCLVDQCKRYKLNIELILVEWNPPANKPRLAEVLSWPKDFGPCIVRIIEVSEKTHKSFIYSEHLPLFQMIAKNVGIRRAKGQFILATNIDILFSDELIRFMSSIWLRKNRLYRVDRYDVPATIPIHLSVKEQLDYCRRNFLRVNGREESYEYSTGQMIPIISRGECNCRIHTNASGDFTLLDRDNWFKLRGYPEFETISTHIDSVFCSMAHHGPARQHLLKGNKVVYHIEHSRETGDTSKLWGAESKNEDNKARKKVPKLANPQVVAWGNQMHREGRALIFNDENWGIAEEQFFEKLINPGAG